MVAYVQEAYYVKNDNLRNLKKDKLKYRSSLTC